MNQDDGIVCGGDKGRYATVIVCVCVFKGTKARKNLRRKSLKNQQEKNHTFRLETINRYSFLGMIFADS